MGTCCPPRAAAVRNTSSEMISLILLTASSSTGRDGLCVTGLGEGNGHVQTNSDSVKRFDGSVALLTIHLVLTPALDMQIQRPFSK